jgi:hypothetical protein
MDTSWIKYVVILLVVGALAFVVNILSDKRQKKRKPPERTFYDVIREDDERLRADIEPEPEPPPLETVRKTGTVPMPQQDPQLRQQDQNEQAEDVPIEYEVQAEQLFELALTHRKMGRLPRISYDYCVHYCRRVIHEFPKSSYAPKAKRILRDLPEEERLRYSITDEEMGL